MSEADLRAAREEMLERHLRGRDIRNEAVLAAMTAVPRERFVFAVNQDEAYADHPLRIACGQTISQPYIVAYMSQLLQAEPGQTVLEIGTGSGYQTAVLAELNLRVITIERHEELLARAVEVLNALGYGPAIDFRLDDGTLGCPEDAPFDRILVAAAAPNVPDALRRQLADGGRMVIPVGTGIQQLCVVERHGDHYTDTSDLAVRFVDLIGKQGFPETPA